MLITSQTVDGFGNEFDKYKYYFQERFYYVEQSIIRNYASVKQLINNYRSSINLKDNVLKNKKLRNPTNFLQSSYSFSFYSLFGVAYIFKILAVYFDFSKKSSVTHNGAHFDFVFYLIQIATSMIAFYESYKLYKDLNWVADSLVLLVEYKDNAFGASNLEDQENISSVHKENWEKLKIQRLVVLSCLRKMLFNMFVATLYGLSSLILLGASTALMFSSKKQLDHSMPLNLSINFLLFFGSLFATPFFVHKVYESINKFIKHLKHKYRINNYIRSKKDGDQRISIIEKSFLEFINKKSKIKEFLLRAFLLILHTTSLVIVLFGAIYQMLTVDSKSSSMRLNQLNYVMLKVYWVCCYTTGGLAIFNAVVKFIRDGYSTWASRHFKDEISRSHGVPVYDLETPVLNYTLTRFMKSSSSFCTWIILQYLKKNSESKSLVQLLKLLGFTDSNESNIGEIEALKCCNPDIFSEEYASFYMLKKLELLDHV